MRRVLVKNRTAFVILASLAAGIAVAQE